jgi:SAM-dependent methyltransferase
MTPVLIDRAALARQRARALAGARPGADFLMALAADDLSDRLAAVPRRFSRALVIGDPTDRVRSAIAGKAETVAAADFLVPGPVGGRPVIDDEALPFAPGSFDLVLSCLTLHWANDLTGALVQIRRVLSPDGLFLGILAGGDSFHELRAALAAAETEIAGGLSPRVLPMTEVRDAGALMQRAGFAMPVADQDRLTLRYDDAFALMADLRAMGAGNCLAERLKTPTRRAVLLRAAEIYGRDHADADGRVRATLTLVSLSGWAPAPGQPKPLRPGSATVSLADVLGHARTRRSDE